VNEPPGSPDWVVKLDRRTGKILGYVPVSERAGLHSVQDAGEGQSMTDVGIGSPGSRGARRAVSNRPTNAQGAQIVSLGQANAAQKILEARV
jgi:hypothetical protein